VEIINTVLNNTYEVDLLVLDESHRYASSESINLFQLVRYRYVLGLTATFERLDGRHELLTPYIPICDVITLQDALKNG
jgi:superfamily II DNA or RNA helicase